MSLYVKSFDGDIVEEKKGGKKGEMTVGEAGRKGGEETARTHGREFFEKIGHKGGDETAKTHGPEFYREIGHKGGEKGGQKVRELIKKGESAEEKK
jgi:hypothetical protein